MQLRALRGQRDNAPAFRQSLDAFQVAIEAINGDGPNNEEEYVMIIGQFTKTKEGNFTGSITAIGAVISKVALEAVTAEGKGPNFHVTAQGCDLGAAWNKTSERTGKDYLSVSLRSPFVSGPIYAALVETDQSGKFTLVWNEPKAKSAE